MRAAEEVDLLGMERVIDRAYERAVSSNPKRTEEWQRLELEAARRARQERREAQP